MEVADVFVRGRRSGAASKPAQDAGASIRPISGAPAVANSGRSRMWSEQNVGRDPVEECNDSPTMIPWHLRAGALAGIVARSCERGPDQSAGPAASPRPTGSAAHVSGQPYRSTTAGSSAAAAKAASAATLLSLSDVMRAVMAAIARWRRSVTRRHQSSTGGGETDRHSSPIAAVTARCTRFLRTRRSQSRVAVD